ncbi:hypothetical protein BJ508DRAFT_410133 [Ascobolus immersus RN42]|uniref:F-box domain-containing protein n=1 Tax=Ascobolus immersus RN42 TaxID=1160509 RepID=A0A3N4J306_ASCIM|nr:hypothetical protein BJ508DRAFT_410133 [Ascobolus immersus RN42]
MIPEISKYYRGRAMSKSAKPTPTPSLLTLPSKVLVEIFSSCSYGHSALALAQTHPTLRKIYKENDCKIHTELANRNFGPLVIRLLQSGHPGRTTQKTQEYLPSIAEDVFNTVPDSMIERFLTRANGDKEKMPEIFPFFWRLELGLWMPIVRSTYCRMAYERRITLWQSFTSIVPLEQKVWREATEKRRRDELATVSDGQQPTYATYYAFSEGSAEVRQIYAIVPAIEKPTRSCSACSDSTRLCLWHGALDHEEESFIFEYETYCQNEHLYAHPFPTSILWEAFLHYMIFFINGTYPLPTNLPAEFESFNCTSPSCTHCIGPDSEFEWRSSPGGDHVWDYSVVESLTKTQAEALGYVEAAMEKRKIYPFRHPYRGSVGQQSYFEYWKALAKHARVHPKTGKLVGLKKAKKKLFSMKVTLPLDRELGKGRIYCQKEIEVHMACGAVVKKTIVENKLVWMDLIWERQEMVRRHQGLPRRDDMERFQARSG